MDKRSDKDEEEDGFTSLENASKAAQARTPLQENSTKRIEPL